MHIVFVHRHGPGQFVHIARRLFLEGWTVTLVCETVDRPVPGLRVLRYGNAPAPGTGQATKAAAPVPFVEAGRRVADILDRLARTDRSPDLVVGHIAWGGMMFVKDVLPDGTLLRAGDPVVTFAARDLAPYRGFPQFMRAAAHAADHDPRTRFVVAGGDGVSYGNGPEDGSSWRTRLLAETGLPPERIHFLGQIPYRDLIRLFQVSAAHVYLTYPFVLSWSFLEAMSCGASIIASATAPVQEVVRNGQNGRLVPFWDTDQIAARIHEALTAPQSFENMRKEARKTILTRYELGKCTARLQRLLARLISAHGRSRTAASNPGTGLFDAAQ